MPSISLTPLTAAHKTAAFDCGEASLNRWLKEMALYNQQENYAKTYIWADAQQNIKAYYALCPGLVSKADMPRRARDNNAPYEIPSMLLARLAVDKTCQGQRIGSLLLLDVFRQTAQAANMIAINALITHPLNAGAEAFYLKHGFAKLRGDKEAMFIPLKTILTVLADGTQA